MEAYEEWQQPVYVTERIAYAAPTRPPSWLRDSDDSVMEDSTEKMRLSCVAPCSSGEMPQMPELSASCCTSRRKGRRRGPRGVWERASSSDVVDLDWEAGSPLVGNGHGRYGVLPGGGGGGGRGVSPESAQRMCAAPFFTASPDGSPGRGGGAWRGGSSASAGFGSSFGAGGFSSGAGVGAGGGSGNTGAGKAAHGSEASDFFGSRPGSNRWAQDVTDFKAILRAGIDVTKRRPSGPAAPPPPPANAAAAAAAHAAAAGAGGAGGGAGAGSSGAGSSRWALFRGLWGGDDDALGDSYEGLITLFLDSAATMLCWSAPGDLELRPELRHAVRLDDIVHLEFATAPAGATVPAGGAASTGAGVAGGFFGGGSGGSSGSGGSGGSGSSGGGEALAPAAGRITLTSARAPQPLVLDVEHEYIYQILARGFASLLNKKNLEGGGVGGGAGGAGVDAGIVAVGAD